MAKRSIQTSKPGYSVGIEHDHLAIRAARLYSDGRGGYSVDRLDEARGDYTDDVALLDGFREIRSALNIGSKDSIIACLSGKQVFATQIGFRRLGAEEMEQALRLEIRKTVHFEVATSTLDYTFLDEDQGSGNGAAQVLVSLAANALLTRELGLLDKAGFNASVVDVLPIAVVNALWGAKNQEGTYPFVALHMGPQVSTIVIDGDQYPFFNRSIYFAAEDVFKPDASVPDRDKRIQSLCDEISRSLVFYGKSANTSGFQEIALLGDFLDGETLEQRLQYSVGFPVRRMDLAKEYGSVRTDRPGKFDLAISLAMRGEI